MCLQALVKYAKLFGGLKGQGAFVLRVDRDEISRFTFDEKKGSISNVDMSADLTKFFKTAAKGKTYEVALSIEDYIFND